jgi:Tfp pilus assembly protein PilO
MKKNLIIACVLLAYILGFWFYYKKVIEPQPSIMADLQTQLAEKTRQKLSAQIISKNLQNVNDLIQNNLVENLSDSLAQSASIPFLNYLTGLMDDLKIVLVSMRPANILRWNETTGARLISQEYIEIPYSMSILASYEQLGQLLEKLEKSQRLIKVARIQLTNPLDFAYFEGEITGKPDQHHIDLVIHTLTILKASYNSGSKQFN